MLLLTRGHNFYFALGHKMPKSGPDCRAFILNVVKEEYNVFIHVCENYFYPL